MIDVRKITKEGSMRVFMIASVLLALTGFLTPASIAADTPATAPNFVLKTAEGQTIELKKLEGKVVIVNFWATWCGPCRAEIPGFINVYKKYQSKGLEIIGISLDSDGWDAVKPYVQRAKIPYPIVMGNGDVADAYGGITAIPVTFILDRKGAIVARHLGMMSEQALESTIKGLL